MALKQGSAAWLTFQKAGAHSLQKHQQIWSRWKSLSGSAHLPQQHHHLPEMGRDCSPSRSLPTAQTSVDLLCFAHLPFLGWLSMVSTAREKKQNLGVHLRRSLDLFLRYKSGQNGGLSWPRYAKYLESRQHDEHTLLSPFAELLSQSASAVLPGTESTSTVPAQLMPEDGWFPSSSHTSRTTQGCPTQRI